MKVENGIYNPPVTIGDDAETKVARASEGKTTTGETQAAGSAQDTVDISPQAAKLSASDARQQAALASIALINQRNDAVTQTDSGEGKTEGTTEQDLLTKFVNSVFRMLEERQVIQQKNAEEQVEKQRETEAAHAERKAEREDALAGEETAPADGQQAGTNTAGNAPYEARHAAKPGGVAASYGKKGTFVAPASADGAPKGSYKAQA